MAVIVVKVAENETCGLENSLNEPLMTPVGWLQFL